MDRRKDRDQEFNLVDDIRGRSSVKINRNKPWYAQVISQFKIVTYHGEDTVSGSEGLIATTFNFIEKFASGSDIRIFRNLKH